jgi:hypothetical protein
MALSSGLTSLRGTRPHCGEPSRPMERPKRSTAREHGSNGKNSRSPIGRRTMLVSIPSTSPMAARRGGLAVKAHLDNHRKLGNVHPRQWRLEDLMGRHGWVVVLFVVFGSVSCSSEASFSAPSEKKTLVAWHPTPLQGESTGDVGADCSKGGAASCKSTICLHVSPVHNQGFVCSVECRQPDNCPPEWTCGSLIAGMSERICAPPKAWNGKTAAIPVPLVLGRDVLPTLSTPAQIREELQEAEKQRRGQEGRRDGGMR